MDTLPLSTEDRLYLRSRAFLVLGIFLLFAAGAVLSAFQAQTESGGINYAWLAVVIITVAGAFAFSRILLRLVRDLSYGQKRILEGEVKLEDKEYVLWLNGRRVPLPAKLSAQVAEGQKIKASRSKSGVFLSLVVD